MFESVNNSLNTRTVKEFELDFELEVSAGKQSIQH